MFAEGAGHVIRMRRQPPGGRRADGKCQAVHPALAAVIPTVAFVAEGKTLLVVDHSAVEDRGVEVLERGFHRLVGHGDGHLIAGRLLVHGRDLQGDLLRLPLAIRLRGVAAGHCARFAPQRVTAAAIEVSALNLQPQIGRGMPVGPQLVDRPRVAVLDHLKVIQRNQPRHGHDAILAGASVDPQGIVPDRAGDRVLHRGAYCWGAVREEQRRTAGKRRGEILLPPPGDLPDQLRAIAGRRERPIFGGHRRLTGGCQRVSRP